MPSERGQGTIEWTGLVLLVALVLGGLAAAAVRARPGPAGPELGETLAERILGLPSAAPPARAPRRVPKGPPPPPAAGLLPLGALSVPGALRGREPFRRVRLPRVPVDDGLRVLRDVAGKGVNRLWIGCFAYRRFRYPLQQGHTSIRPVPVGEGLRTLNTCLNPLEFLGED